MSAAPLSAYIPTHGALLARFLHLPDAGADPADRLLLSRGDLSDYGALARFHYRAGPPATHVRVLRLADPLEGATAAALVVSMPTLNGAWRRLAWPGRYDTGDRRRDAARLNAEVRTISRVVVDPRWRGLGVARRLVRAYLDRPLTPATEAPAAMGACCPFFARAGMTEYRLPPSARDARLLDALHGADLAPWQLFGAGAALARLSDPMRRLVESELHRWADASRATRARAPDDPLSLARLAGAALGAERIAYAHTTP